MDFYLIFHALERFFAKKGFCDCVSFFLKGDEYEGKKDFISSFGQPSHSRKCPIMPFHLFLLNPPEVLSLSHGGQESGEVM